MTGHDTVSARLAAALLVAASIALGATSSRAAEMRATASIACVDPKATFVLTDPDMLARHSFRWRASIGRRGRCFTIEPGERWERVIAAGGLVLMRKVPPEPGVPPLYFRTEASAAGAAPIEDPGTTIRGRAEARRGTPGLEFGALANPPRPPARKLRAGRAVTEILTETLPPLPTAQLPDAAGLASRSPVLAAEPPALPALPALPPLPVGRPVVAAPAPLDAAMAPVPGPNLSLASARGYEFGFAITMILTVLLLAALVLLLRWLLRPPAAPEQAPPGEFDERAQRPAPIAPSLADRIAAIGAGRDPPPPSSPQPGQLVRPWRAPVLLGALPVGASAWQPARTRSAPEFGVVAEQEACAALLREAGWEANAQPGSDRRRADGRRPTAGKGDGAALPATRQSGGGAGRRGHLRRPRARARGPCRGSLQRTLHARCPSACRAHRDRDAGR